MPTILTLISPTSRCLTSLPDVTSHPCCGQTMRQAYRGQPIPPDSSTRLRLNFDATTRPLSIASQHVRRASPLGRPPLPPDPPLRRPTYRRFRSNPSGCGPPAPRPDYPFRGPPTRRLRMPLRALRLARRALAWLALPSDVPCRSVSSIRSPRRALTVRPWPWPDLPAQCDTSTTILSAHARRSIPRPARAARLA